MKLIFSILAIFTGAFFYFEFNPSYRLSVEARFYFALSDYEEAYKLADESLKIREYNTMAFHIKTRSQIALNVINFNLEADKFESDIRKIVTERSLTRGDKLKIKMISDIIISKYKNLSLDLVDDIELIEKAKRHFHNFEKINGDVLKSLSRVKEEEI
jgi:HEPN domain-containing protein